ncbi:hypothetical protein V6N13_024193 [Hibiscus sabdariffa]
MVLPSPSSRRKESKFIQGTMLGLDRLLTMPFHVSEACLIVSECEGRRSSSLKAKLTLYSLITLLIADSLTVEPIPRIFQERIFIYLCSLEPTSNEAISRTTSSSEPRI